ncbi:MAG: PKD domain-containing protein, partial [Bacteroidetes bacterium]|nr:PKD domain-containing protein [Bacteroidota bacterium]
STNPFTPAQSNDWCMGPVGANCFTIDLSAFAGNSNVVIRFETYTNYQNNLYLDNINISGVSSNQPPVADFTASTTFGCGPLSVTFTDLSTPAATSWSWSFPGATPATSNQPNPSVVYASPGFYPVTLTATNAFGSDMITKSSYIIVNACAPVNCDTLENFNNGTLALYTGSGFSGYASGHNSFEDQAKAEYFNNASNATYLTGLACSFGVAVPDNPATSTLTFAIWDDSGAGGSPGTILATRNVLINDIASDISNSQLTFVDFPSPVLINGNDFYAGFLLSYGPNGEIEDTVAVFTNTDLETSPATAWEQWSNNSWFTYDDNSSWGLEVAHAIVAFTTDTLPTADFLVNNTQVCQGDTVLFANISSGGNTFEWFFPGGTPSSSTDPNPIVVYNTAGAHDVTMIVYGECFGSDTKTVSGQVTVSGGPAISVVSQVNEACSQGNGSATVSASGGAGNYTYSWNTTPAQTGPTATGLSFGNYTVFATDANGCQSQTMISILDQPGPLAAINSWQDESCGLNNGSATASATSGTMPYTYSWTTTPPQTSATATGLNSGTYQVYITDANNCQDVAQVTIGGTPEVLVSTTTT